MRILRYPYDAQLLRLKARPVRDDEFGSEAIEAFCRELGATMIRAGGSGLASTQVDERPGGEPWSIFVLAAGPGRYGVVCNPEISHSGKSAIGMEACLSFDSIPEAITAPDFVILRGKNPAGKEFEMALEGDGARAAAHEVDHLQGRLLIDRMSPVKRKLFLKKLDKLRSREVNALATGLA